MARSEGGIHGVARELLRGSRVNNCVLGVVVNLRRGLAWNLRITIGVGVVLLRLAWVDHSHVGARGGLRHWLRVVSCCGNDSL